MADIPLSALPSVLSALPGDYLIGNFSGATSRIGLSNLAAALTGLGWVGSNATVANLSYSGALTGGAGLSYTDTGVFNSYGGSLNSYIQQVIQNRSAGAAASTNYNVSNDLGSPTANYAEFGINSSGFTGVGSFSLPGAAYLAAASTDLVIGTYGPKPIRFVVNNGATDAATIDANGFNGRIGATTPSTGAFTALSASGKVSASTSAGVGGFNIGRRDTGSSSWEMYSSAGNWQLFSAAAVADVVTIDPSGNLGIMVTPNAWSVLKAVQLGARGHSFYGDNGSSEMGLTSGAYWGSGGWAYATTNANYVGKYTIANGKHSWSAAPNGTAGAAITWAQAMTLDVFGNLFLSQAATGYSSGNAISLEAASAGRVLISHASGAASGAGYVGFAYAGAQIGSITQNGTTGVLFNTSSDRRLKTNIQDSAPASSLLDSMRVRQFDWISDGSHQRYGFVAQELVQVAPEAVHQPFDPEEMMSVDYSKLVPVIVKELQDLRTRVRRLEVH